MKRYEQGSVGMRPDPKGSWCDYIEVQAEIERLRKRNTEALKVRDAEIERLRGEEAHTRVLLQGEKAQAKADKAELRAEIERLRGLLLDADDGLDDYWICRRSEALGE